MRKTVKSNLFLGLAIHAIFVSGMATAATNVDVTTSDIRFNDIGVGVDKTGGRLFYSLGAGYNTAKAFAPVLKYKGSRIVECGGAKLKSGQTCNFKPVKYGDASQDIKVYDASGKLKATYKMVFTNLPVVSFKTGNPVDYNRIVNLNYKNVAAELRVMSGANKQDTDFQPIEADRHGQTSKEYKKPSFNIQFRTNKSATSKSKEVALLDMKAADDWILDASYIDTSFARNNVTMDIFNAIHPNKDPLRKGGKNAIEGRLVEMIANGKYQGAFVLNEKPGPSLLGLPKKSGSYLYKVDFARWGGVNGNNPFFGPYQTADFAYNFAQTYPDGKANFTPIKGLIDFVIGADEVDFADSIADRVDLEALADWYLLVEATQAHDNISKNQFWLKPAGSNKFTIAPWDHNSSYGMFWNGTAEASQPPYRPIDNNLLIKLMDNVDTGFNTLLKQRWNTLRKTELTEAKIMARFAKYRSQLTVGGAAARNAAIWPQPDNFNTTGPNGKPLTIKISNPALSTPAYISKFLKQHLAEVNAYINELPE
jgi:CotH kinase protein